MIVIRNRKMVIPYEDVYIGTSYDTNTEIRMFKVQRYTSNHKDLSALIFRLDLRYNITDQNAADTVMLSKEVHDDYILLKWEITESVLQAPGTAFINLRATENGTNRWSTFIAAVYIGHTLYTPGSYTGSLTEIEQMEADYDHFKQVIEDLEPLVNLTDTAEAWAVGQRNGHDVTSSDITYHNNAKYYSGTAMYAAADSENFRNLSQAYAEGKIGSQDVDSDDPAYHNNAKYYRDNAATSAGLSVAMAETAEAWAEGEINDDPVDSSHPAYHNNAKYYAEQAGTSATAAAQSAGQAGTIKDATEFLASSAGNSALNSEAWAVGKRGNVDVGSSDQTYHNNAKYYAEQAAGSATTAQQSAEQAGASAGLANTYKNQAQSEASNAAGSATNAALSALDASDAALNAEAWAKGTRNGTDVGSSDDAYHKNAKYYSEQAAASASAAAASAASLTVDAALSDTSTNPVQNKVVTAEFANVKSAIDAIRPVEYSTKSNTIFAETEVPFAGATDGMLQSNGTVSGSTNYCVTDYIPLDDVNALYRYGSQTKYNVEAYALYNSGKQMIPGTYHARSNQYTYTSYASHKNVVFYDISAQGAKYIRLTKDKSYNLTFVEELKAGADYVVLGNVSAPNIEKNIRICKVDNKGFVLFRSDRDTFFEGKVIYLNDGLIYDNENYNTSDYIRVEAQTKYATGWGYTYACYDEHYSLLEYGGLYDINITGSNRYHFLTTPANCRYIRICWHRAEGASYPGLIGLQKVPTVYDVVNLGDSIFGVNPCCFDISTIAQEKSGFNFANSGFGGSQASTYPDSSAPYYSFNLWKLADAIYASDFTEQDASAAAIEQTDGSILYVQRLTILKSVNFDTVKLITIAYGTNDCSKNVALDNENDLYDKTTFCGALRYSIEKLYSRYPGIKIALISPPYGRKGTNNEYSTDVWTNSLGLKLIDYVNAMKDVADEYHIPFFNHYSNMGINDYNWNQYLRDGTHLSLINGANLIGAKVGQEVSGLLADY